LRRIDTGGNRTRQRRSDSPAAIGLIGDESKSLAPIDAEPATAQWKG
jgi:hypothetical protein